MQQIKISIILSIIVLLVVPFFITTRAHADIASYYGAKFHGRKTASGEVFNMNALTCASNTHKIGTRLLVTNLANNKSVVVRVNDTGGFKKYGRTLDLSKGAFSKIADTKLGLIKVKIKELK